MNIKQSGFANDGALIPQLQRVQVTQERGAPIPSLPKVPTPSPAPATPDQSSASDNSNSKNSSQGTSNKNS